MARKHILSVLAAAAAALPACGIALVDADYPSAPDGRLVSVPYTPGEPMRAPSRIVGAPRHVKATDGREGRAVELAFPRSDSDAASVEFDVGNDAAISGRVSVSLDFTVADYVQTSDRGIETAFSFHLKGRDGRHIGMVSGVAAGPDGGSVNLALEGGENAALGRFGIGRRHSLAIVLDAAAKSVSASFDGGERVVRTLPGPFKFRVFSIASGWAVGGRDGRAVLVVDRVRITDEATPPQPLGRVVDGPFVPEGIGEWDGREESAVLERPYEDPSQAAAKFGEISYYKDGWRSYMDTWPARRFDDILAVNWTDLSKDETEPTMRLFRECGFRRFRCELGWGSFSFDGPPRLSEEGERRLEMLLGAAKRTGMRPLVLQNANSCMPAPSRERWVELAAPAAAGAREVRLAGEVPAFRTGRTGFEGQRGYTAYPLVVALERDGGETVARLSAPLEHDVPAGRTRLRELRFAPFAGDVFADGTPNPDASETIAGWTEYVAAVAEAFRRHLGTDGVADACFDFEVWNEYTFGSEFLDERNYYSPARRFSHYPEHSDGSRSVPAWNFAEIVLPLTVAYVRDSANALPGVNVISGFSNQRPWDCGESMWPGQSGFSKHYYTGLNPGMAWSGTDGLLSPETEDRGRLGNPPVGADGSPDESRFVPSYRASCPESLFMTTKTETFSRDVEPVPNVMEGHFRYSHPGDGRPPLLWQTEYNTYRRPFAEFLEKAYGMWRGDARMNAILDYAAAKAFARSAVFMCHKGLDTLFFFASRNPWDEFGVLPDAYWRELALSGCELTDGVRAAAGGQMHVARRLSRLLGRGRPLDSVRSLSVERVVEHRPRLVFRGNGTKAAPDLFHRDDLAILPFQMDARTYAIAFYVVTRDILHPWDASRDLLDAKRYEMPPQRFDVTFSNIAGGGAKADVYDPMSGARFPAEVLSAEGSRLSVALPATDSPRFLIVREAEAGPLASGIVLSRNDAAAATLAFVPETDCDAVIEWGPVPGRAERSRTVGAKAGRRTEIRLDGFERGWGARLRLRAKGLECSWPHLGHDVAGRMEFDPPARAEARRAPAAAVSFPDGCRRLGRDGLPEGFEFVEGGQDELAAALPSLAVSDAASVSYAERDGVPSCTVSYRLDATMHPDEGALSFSIEVLPAEGGFAVSRRRR